MQLLHFVSEPWKSLFFDLVKQACDSAKPEVRVQKRKWRQAFRRDLTHFYAEHFIFANPAINLTTVSRTIREDQLVEELVLSLNHDRMVHWMLPGVPPTGRHITVPLVAIVRFAVDPTDEKWKLKHEHIYWDQASVLEQLGLLKNFVHTYPGVALGAVQAQSVLLGQGANAGRQSRGEAPEAEL
ncbi:unnamed protein product [Durusdinium trenchii]|uniref:Uncharacterized protein n=1 Tax=Durusdinium trenchii TaxID=1381693 RepID=A0ABP0SY88_9DINO